MNEAIIESVKRFSLKDERIKIDDIEIIPEKKLSIVLRFLDTRMFSFEILPDKTCDFLIVDVKSGDIIFSRTTKFADDLQLETEIIRFIQEIDSVI